MKKSKIEAIDKKPKPTQSLIGGQALMEGVMMRSQTSMALAVRDPSGHILVDTKRFKSGNKWYKKIPVLRGVFAFVQSLILNVTTVTKAAEVLVMDETPAPKKKKGKDKQAEDSTIQAENSENQEKNNSMQAQNADKHMQDSDKQWKNPVQQESQQEKDSSGAMGFLMALSVLAGLALGIGLFFLLPLVLSSWIESFLPNQLVLSLVEGGIRIVIFLLYLLLTSWLEPIKRMFGYHGAEHQVINCFEKNLALDVTNAQSCSTRHNRCGTTFLFFVMIVSILVFSLVTWLLELIGLNRELVSNATLMGAIRFAIRLALLPFVAGVSFELLRMLAKLPDNGFTLIFRAPGLALQRLTTYAPSVDMTEVALAAFTEVQRMDADAELSELSFGQFRYTVLREEVEKRLQAVGAELVETDWIFCEVTDCKRSELAHLTLITHAQYKRIADIVLRRTGKSLGFKEVEKNFCGPIQVHYPKPLWYVLGHTDFYGNTITVNESVLIPRAETELLAEEAIKSLQAKGDTSDLSALDLCTGSGCIALSLAKNTSGLVVASDISQEALAVATINLEGTGVVVLQSDLFENISDTFDVIVSNPPYIATAEIDTLDPLVKECEPLQALDGGEDGLDFYRRIATTAPTFLKPNGVLLLEVGYTQASEVMVLLTQNGFVNIEILKDLEGVARIVKATAQ